MIEIEDPFSLAMPAKIRPYMMNCYIFYSNCSYATKVRNSTKFFAVTS